MTEYDVDLSIIIVNWNTRDLLAQCLESVLDDHQINADGVLDLGPFSSDVFVVDNASTDGSPRMVRESFPWVRLIENTENLGFARANNQAIQQSRGRCVLLLNSDTKVHAGALETMVQFLESHSRAAGCGPLLLNGDGSLQPSCHPMLTPEREFWRLLFLERLWRRATYPQTKWDRKTPRQVEVIKGACFMLRRAALDQVGVLDEGYFMYTEEMDLCYRLLQAEWHLWWVPQAVVVHYGEASSRQMAEEMYVQLYRSKVQFHRKFGGDQQVARFKLFIYFAYGPRWAIIALGAILAPGLVPRARIYRHLLTELATM